MVLSRVFSFSFVDSSGIPLDGGEMWTYLSDGTEVLTYKDPDGKAFNTNPVILDSRGCASFYIDNAVEYLFVLKDRNGNTVWSADHVTANTKTFVAEGSDTIEATEQVVDGKTVVTFRVKEGSIGVNEFKNPLPLVAGDGIKLTPHDVGDATCIVISSEGAGGGVSEEYVDEAVASEARRSNLYTDNAIGNLDIPTKTSELENDIGFITNARGTWENITNKLGVISKNFSSYYVEISLNRTIGLLHLRGYANLGNTYSSGTEVRFFDFNNDIPKNFFSGDFMARNVTSSTIALVRVTPRPDTNPARNFAISVSSNSQIGYFDCFSDFSKINFEEEFFAYLDSKG